MSYRLIDANKLNGMISDEDYNKILKVPCIYADLPNGLDEGHYSLIGEDENILRTSNGSTPMTVAELVVRECLSDDEWLKDIVYYIECYIKRNQKVQEKGEQNA